MCLLTKDLFVNSGVIIKNGTTIKNIALINTSASIDHDNVFDDFSSCGPGVITGGNVRLENRLILVLVLSLKKKLK